MRTFKTWNVVLILMLSVVCSCKGNDDVKEPYFLKIETTGSNMVDNTVSVEVDERFSVGSAFLLFADGDEQNRYVGDINVARISLYEKAMTLDDVFALGRVELP